MQTDRLILRERTTEKLTEVFNKSIEEQLLFFGYDDDSLLVRDRRGYELGYDNWRMTWKLWDLIRIDDSVVIGHCGYHSWYKDHHRAEVGYALNKDVYMQQGYMSEALAAVLHFGFNDMDLNRVEAMIGPSNGVSQKLINKYGFQKEGVMRGHYKKNGKFEDSIIFALLKADYQNLR